MLRSRVKTQSQIRGTLKLMDFSCTTGYLMGDYQYLSSPTFCDIFLHQFCCFSRDYRYIMLSCYVSPFHSCVEVSTYFFKKILTQLNLPPSPSLFYYCTVTDTLKFNSIPFVLPLHKLHLNLYIVAIFN